MPLCKLQYCQDSTYTSMKEKMGEKSEFSLISLETSDLEVSKINQGEQA